MHLVFAFLVSGGSLGACLSVTLGASLSAYSGACPGLAFFIGNILLLKLLRIFSCEPRNNAMLFRKDLFQLVLHLYSNHLIYKIHKRLSNVPGRPVISNWCTATEKASEFLDFYLKPLMQNGWLYVRDSSDFIGKMKRIGKIPEGSFLVLLM